MKPALVCGHARCAFLVEEEVICEGLPEGTETAWMTTPKEKAELVRQLSETDEMMDAVATRYDEWVGLNRTE